MSEEKIKVLKMIEEGIISAEEGFQLLEAIGESNVRSEFKNHKSPKWIRIRIMDASSGKNVNVKLPVAIIKTGLKIGERFSVDVKNAMQDVNFEEVIQAINDGVTGEIVRVETDEGETVIITLE